MTKSKAPSHRVELSAPPYISYRTFVGFIERLRRGMPSRIDRSVMSSLSGSNQSQLMATLRYLELISHNGLPTERLSKLVNSQDAQVQRGLREILLSSYPFLFKSFDLQKATFDELREQFVGAGASGDTVRKCVAFFLGAAKHAGLQISPFVTSRSRLRVRPSPRSLEADQKTDGDNGRGYDSKELHTWREMLISKLPEFDAHWSPEMKSKWFDAFDKLITWMESADQS
ncbi:MAG TPA: DUF5343 domain-containing protein [Candidatus Acidoferrum sp.]|nr:DUF5343 domain-containing protein [Candidatus Acidoferrum sp.]